MQAIRRKSRGFSLLELALCLGVVAILLAIIVPLYTRNRSNQLLNSTVQVMVAHLNQGKTVAMTTSPTAVPVVNQSHFGPVTGMGKGASLVPANGNTNNTIHITDTINQYLVVQPGASGGEQTLRGPVAIDPSITAQVSAAQSYGNQPGAGVTFASNEILFSSSGATFDNKSATVVLSNTINQFRITVNANGNVTSAQEAQGTPL